MRRGQHGASRRGNVEGTTITIGTTAARMEGLLAALRSATKSGFVLQWATRATIGGRHHQGKWGCCHQSRLARSISHPTVIGIAASVKWKSLELAKRAIHALQHRGQLRIQRTNSRLPVALRSATESGFVLQWANHARSGGGHHQGKWGG